MRIGGERLTRGATVTSVVLAVGILGVFVRLQEFGPESAIRKFHQAITRRSLDDLQKVTEEDVRTPGVQALIARIGLVMQSGGNRFRILRTDRKPDEVRAAVAYTLANGTPLFMVWVVDRQGRTWKVNVEKTARVMPEALGG